MVKLTLPLSDILHGESPFASQIFAVDFCCHDPADCSEDCGLARPPPLPFWIISWARGRV